MYIKVYVDILVAVNNPLVNILCKINLLTPAHLNEFLIKYVRMYMFGHFKHEYTNQVVIDIIECHDVQFFENWWNVCIKRCRDHYPDNFLLNFN